MNEPVERCDPATEAQLRGWLDAFAAAVRDVDYAAGEPLFAFEVVGFGTVGVMLAGRDTLIASQWKRVWGVTSGFHFDTEQLAFSMHGPLAWLAIPWASRTGVADRGPFDRKGRATYVLERRAGSWVCVHSHHSIDPSGKPPGKPSAEPTASPRVFAMSK